MVMIDLILGAIGLFAAYALGYWRGKNETHR